MEPGRSALCAFLHMPTWFDVCAWKHGNLRWCTLQAMEELQLEMTRAPTAIAVNNGQN